MKCYKGFSKEMKCRDFQYEENNTYTSDDASLCESGFHACEYPLHCFKYYAPACSVYHEVELDVTEEIGLNDSKRVGKTITIGKQLTVDEMIDESLKTTHGQINRSVKSNDKRCSIVCNDIHNSTAINAGAFSTAVNFGNYSASVNNGDFSYSINHGTRSVASNKGALSLAANSGEGSLAVNTGECSVAINTGYYSAASCEEGCSSLSIAFGYGSKAKAPIGSAICVSEWGDLYGNCNRIINIKAAIIDGEVLKPDVYYTLKNGEFVEAEE